MAEDPRRIRLDEIAREKAALQEQMAGRATEFQQAAVDWARSEWEHAVQHAIERNPDTVKALAADGRLSSLKQNLKQLVEAAPEKASVLLDDAALWSHLTGKVFETDGSPKRSDTHFYEGYGTRQPPKALDEPLRLLKGEVLALLVEADLLEQYERTSVERRGQRYRYPFALDWSDELSEHIGAYSKAYQAFVALEEERRRIDAELDKEEANRLWDEA